MKLVMEIESLDSGLSKKGPWTRIVGTDARGRFAKAHTFGKTAEALSSALSKLLMPGEEIGNRGFTVDLTGDWMENTRTNNEGKTFTVRSFQIQTFDILMGPVAELAKIRRLGAAALKASEAHRRDGRLDLAYRSVSEFLSSTVGVPLDLSDLQDHSADDEAYGLTENSDPEAAAVAHFQASGDLEVEQPLKIGEQPSSEAEEDIVSDEESASMADSLNQLEEDHQEEADVSERSDEIEDTPAKEDRRETGASNASKPENKDNSGPKPPSFPARRPSFAMMGRR